MPLTILTVGHSNRSLDAFVAILKAHGVECLADVRTIPRSRHNPQFNAETLQKSLSMAGIVYTRLPRLGGLRKPRKDSRNLAWRNDSFRGYADYMETTEFEKGIAELLALARDRRTAILCAEALYYRCHRSLISDALVSRGRPDGLDPRRARRPVRRGWDPARQRSADPGSARDARAAARPGDLLPPDDQYLPTAEIGDRSRPA